MAIHSFTWNGVSSTDMHIRVPDPVPVIRPEERVQHVTIPGRMGELTQLEGDAVYNSYIQTVNIVVEGADNVRAALLWLRGSGTVTFSAQPTMQQKARIINAITLDKMSRNLSKWTGEIQFYCDPVKSLISETDITVTETGATITNNGDLPAQPLITITGSGTSAIIMGGTTLTLPDMAEGTVIDCEMGWVLVNNVPQLNAWSGSFPEIPVGESGVLFSGGITQLDITPRWRYL